MPNITLSISDELKKQMDTLPEFNWSEIVRDFLSKKVKRARLLSKLDKMLENSEITDDDCLSLGKEIKKGRFNKLKAKGLI